MLSPMHYNLCYTHDILNTKAIQPVLHARHSTQRPSNQCYTHDIPTQRPSNQCYTHDIPTQSPPSQCYTHDIQHKVLPASATRTTLSFSQPVLHDIVFFPTCAAHTTFNVKSSCQPVLHVQCFSQPVLHTTHSM